MKSIISKGTAGGSYNNDSILFGERVFSVCKLDDGTIIFTEECDGYFCEEFDTKEDAINSLLELIEEIKEL